MIIAMVNSKGGVGKSTLAGSLVGWLHTHGHRVILADCDTQQSSSEWIHEALPDVPVCRLANADEVFEELPLLSREAEFVIADGPGSQTETSRALLMFADLAVLPCKASMFEARALDKNTAFVRHAQTIRQGPPPAVAVLSMVGRDYRLTKDMLDAAEALQLTVAIRRSRCGRPMPMHRARATSCGTWDTPLAMPRVRSMRCFENYSPRPLIRTSCRSARSVVRSAPRSAARPCKGETDGTSSPQQSRQCGSECRSRCGPAIRHRRDADCADHTGS